jgi:hypothetical protein
VRYIHPGPDNGGDHSFILRIYCLLDIMLEQHGYNGLHLSSLKSKRFSIIMFSAGVAELIRYHRETGKHTPSTMIHPSGIKILAAHLLADERRYLPYRQALCVERAGRRRRRANCEHRRKIHRRAGVGRCDTRISR